MGLISAGNVLMGPCDVYIAAFGATEPTLGTWTAPVSPWTDAGATTGGVKFTVSMDFKAIEVDQVPDEIGVRMTKRAIAVETTMAESTLDNIQTLMNGGTQASGTGYETFEPLSSTASFVPTYSAILLRGQAPGTNTGYYRHFIVRKVLSTDGFEIEQTKDAQQGLKAKFAGYYVSTSILPFQIIDQVA